MLLLLLQITNSSKIPVNYSWVFADEEIEEKSKDTNKFVVWFWFCSPLIGFRIRSWATRPGDNKTPLAKPTSVNQVFDIVPIRGTLQPGDSEDVEFSFYGHADAKVRSLLTLSQRSDLGLGSCGCGCGCRFVRWPCAKSSVDRTMKSV